MNSQTRRRDDRSAADPYKQWIPTADKYPPDHDSDRRRNRSATLPAHSYDPRSYPSQDARYNDPRQPSRTHRQDPHYPSTAPSAQPSYHHSSAPIPPTSKAYQHATRPSAQYSSSGYHYPQPSSYQPSHPTPAYPVASSSRRPHPDAPDPRISRRPSAPTHHPSYECVSSGEEISKASRHPSRPTPSSAQPPLSASANQQFWNPPQDMSSSRRHKDPYRDHDRDQERERDRERDKEREREQRDRDRERERDKERDRDKDKPEPEIRYKDRTKPERHRERERATEVRHQEPSRSKHHDKRKDSDTEGVIYPEQRNASKVSFTGKEGYPSSTRESGSGHRKHRTEDGTASNGRRLQPENTQNPITTMPSQPSSVPPPDVQQTGEPPPAPRVMPVYLPPKAKSQRSHREGRPSTAQGAQSGSDTERATGKHRMERTPSGPAIQRSDPYASSSTRERANHDASTGPRDDVKRMEGKYGAQHDSRQPLAPINVDIPLVTPGFNASTLPSEARIATAPQRVSIRAGQGPSDPHGAYSKLSTTPHPNVPQEIVVHPPPSASIVKSSSHAPSRSQSSEMRPQYDRPAVEQSRTEPHGDDLPPGQRMSIHESSRVLPTPISKSHSYARGNPETAADNTNSSYPHSRPPSRSAHRTPSNNTVPPAVVGPRPLRSVSQGPQTNEPFTRPPSVAQYPPTIPPAQIQYSVPPSPVHVTNGSPPKAENTHVSLLSAHPSPKNAPLHGVSLTHSTFIHQASSVPPTAHPTPITAPQPLTTSSRPSTRDGARTDVPSTLQQSAERQLITDDRQGLRQTSNSTAVKATWVVQTPATAKKTKISREDKYLPRHNINSETPHPQLRQVLSQDNDPFSRTFSSMMKASQATTPTTSSQRNSPGTRTRESFSTPRGTMASGSPRSWSAKEAPTPEHISRPSLAPHLTGPPQIAVVGATPITSARELPQGRMDHTLLAPPFPAPTRASRTTSSSQDQQSQPPQPVARTTSSSSQPPPPMPVHAPSLFQPYRPPSLPPAEDTGQFSPPPLPVPPPRGPEDSPPLIETRTSEIIRTRSYGDEHPQSHGHFIPEVKSEMFHIPSQLPAPSQPSSATPSRTSQTWQPGKLDSNAMVSNGSIPVAQPEALSSKPALVEPDDVQTVHQEIMVSVPATALQPLAPPIRPRPKVTVEDVTEDSPVLSKAGPTSVPMVTPVPGSRFQPSQHTIVANASSTFKSAVVDQAGHKPSPQSGSQEPPLHPSTEHRAMFSATPISTAAPPMSTRVPSSAPPTQPAPFTSAQALPTQRTASQTTSSRTYHRAAEMLQADKLSASVGIHPGATGSINNRSTGAPVQAAYNPVGIATGHHQQSANSVNALGPSAPRPINALFTAPHPSVSAAASMTKAAAVHTTTNNPGPSVGMLGLPVPSTSVGAQQPPAPDFRQQPNRPGAFSIPPLDATTTTVMSTTAVKNAHQEQPVIDATRLRDVTPSAARNPAPSSHVYPTSSRPGISSTITQQTHVTPAQPSVHHRTVSLPIASSSSAPQKPPSPRKYSQPIPSATVSTQPFPSRPSAPEPQSTRAPVSGNVVPPAQARLARLPPERAHDFDMLKTPSSIAPSPILNPNASAAVPQSIAVPVRARQSSTDSKDDKKKPTGLFGLFRTRTLSSKAVDPPAVPTATRASLDQGRVHPDTSNVTSATTSAPRGITSASAPRGLNSAQAPVASISARVGSQSKATGRVPNPVPFPPPPQVARERKDPVPHMFTPFKLLSMHTNKRNRTVSAASLDVCDGNTATNTVIGSPDHSAVSQAQPLPQFIPPGIRDPLIATSEWRDREEAERRDRRKYRIRRPGVTFDVEEEPPSPAPGTLSKRKKLVRRPTGRTGTPGPPRG